MTENEQIQEMEISLYEAQHEYDKAWTECFHNRGKRPERENVFYAKYLVEKKGYRKIPDNIGEFSDGYHTFNELYHHRAVLFSVICNMFPEKSWKSKLHDTGDMFEGMFIVGIETEQGQATYHYDIEPYWDMFKVKELEKAPKWDGHTSNDAIQRIGDISTKGYRKVERGEWIVNHTTSKTPSERGRIIHYEMYTCPICGKSNGRKKPKYCPECGADMRGGV